MQGLKPKFKLDKTIEEEALYYLTLFKPEYLTDLKIKIDYENFIFDFLPGIIKKETGQNKKRKYLSTMTNCLINT